jgi:hypothetical protein
VLGRTSRANGVSVPRFFLIVCIGAVQRTNLNITMKNLFLAVVLILISGFMFAQSSVYLVTEQYSSGGKTDLDQVVVTDPSGNTTAYDIPHLMDDLEGHDKELSKIFNGIIEKGFVLMNSAAPAQGDVNSKMKSIFTRMWILQKVE